MSVRLRPQTILYIDKILSLLYFSASKPQNLALNKTTWQIDTHRGLYTPDKAVDGIKTTVLGGNSCTHTNLKNRAWWAVDLQKRYTIEQVNITNRQAVGKWHYSYSFDWLLKVQSRAQFVRGNLNVF